MTQNPTPDPNQPQPPDPGVQPDQGQPETIQPTEPGQAAEVVEDEDDNEREADEGA